MATDTPKRPPIYSNRQPNPARLAYLRLMADAQDAAAEAIAEYRDFYSGDHPTLLTQRQAAYLNVSLESTFSYNHCPIVVDSLVERLRVTGFSAGQDAALSETLWDWWNANRMDAQQILAHTYAARDGLSFVLVDWDADNQRPGFYVNEAWNGDSGVKVHWAGPIFPGQRILFASKRWRVEFEGDGKEIDTYRRLNIYYPDRIEKYRSGSDAEGEWEPHWDESDDQNLWPMPWVDDQGEPLGVPVVVFLNKQSGVSELKDVLPLQIAINKLLVDLLAAADVEGFGIFTKTGGGLVQSPQVFPGAFWQDTDPAASWGKLPGAEMTGLLQSLDRLTQAVAVVTRRPLSYFTAQATTSGEHLKQLESGLINTAKAAQVTFGNSWEDLMNIALRLAQAFGGVPVPASAIDVSTEWADPESRNEGEHTATVLAKFEKGVIDDMQALRELGYDAETVKVIMLRKELEKLRRMQANPFANRQQPAQPPQEPSEEDNEQEAMEDNNESE